MISLPNTPVVKKLQELLACMRHACKISMRKIATPVLNLDCRIRKNEYGNLLKGVVGQAGNIQETCSRNPALVRRLPEE